MSKTILITIVFTLTILSLIGCTNKDTSAESKELLNGINKATASFEGRSDIQNARALIINSVNRNLSEKDSLIMVESVDKAGAYQCVSYTSHNKMITFYNARKGLDSAGHQSGDYTQVPGEATPYEALAFIDAYQNEGFDEHYRVRNENRTGEISKWWVISFVSKDEDQYTVKSHLSK